MRKRKFLGVTVCLLGVILSAVFFLLKSDLEKSVLERLINHFGRDFFSDSVRIKKASLDGRFKLSLEGVSGVFQSQQGPVPLEMGSFASQDSLLLLFEKQPVKFIFQGVRKEGVPHAGLFGEISVKSGEDWEIEGWADFQQTAIEDFQWLDPENLGGASGSLSGKVTFAQTAGQEPVFEADVRVAKPGGEVQARFFDLFLPYLPSSVQKERLNKLVSKEKQLVRYQTGELKVSLPQSDRMKIFLRILILDYNLNLTLNMTVRTDQKEGFYQIARLLGLIKVKVT